MYISLRMYFGMRTKLTSIFMRIGISCGLLTAPAIPNSAGGTSILFIGNSFTFGQNSRALRYNAENVTDLNGTAMGGVPGIFKTFTQEAGLNFNVNLEAASGRGLDFHFTKRKARVDRAWNHVVLQDQSTLGIQRKGDPELLIEYSRLFANLFCRRNPHVDVRLLATWAYPSHVFDPGGFWFGKSLASMTADIRRGYNQAAASSHIADVIPVGDAFDRAISSGFAGQDPLYGLGSRKVNLWSSDRKHASEYGYYLQALMVFGSITGRDPLSLGRDEKAAVALNIKANEAVAMQQIAHDVLMAHRANSPTANTLPCHQFSR